MLEAIAKRLFGSANDRFLNGLSKDVDAINALEPAIEALSDEELAQRRKDWKRPKLTHQTPWQEISRKFTGQLANGACMDLEGNYFDLANTKGIPRDSH